MKSVSALTGTHATRAAPNQREPDFAGPPLKLDGVRVWPTLLLSVTTYRDIDDWSTAPREVPAAAETISERFCRSVMDQPTDASVPKPNPCRWASGLLCAFGTGGTSGMSRPPVTVRWAELTDRRLGVRLDEVEPPACYCISSVAREDDVVGREVERVSITQCRAASPRQHQTHVAGTRAPRPCPSADLLATVILEKPVSDRCTLRGLTQFTWPRS
jgi:hypothetical protein